jgi:hypothetical protein
LPTGFIQPCLPTKAPRPPAGVVWLAQDEEPGVRGGAAGEGRGLGQGASAMNIEKPWRLEDVKFQDEQNGRRRGEIGPVTVLEIGGKYSLTSHALKLTWFDLDKRSVDAALNAAFNAWRA